MRPMFHAPSIRENRLFWQAGISRVVVGLRHPFGHLRDGAIKALRKASTRVDVLGEDIQGHGIEV